MITVYIYLFLIFLNYIDKNVLNNAKLVNKYTIIVPVVLNIKTDI
jgi:hypothetical protein